MALVTVRHRRFPGRVAQATRLPQPHRRAAGPVFSASGQSGAVGELSHTLLLLLQIGLHLDIQHAILPDDDTGDRWHSAARQWVEKKRS